MRLVSFARSALARSALARSALGWSVRPSAEREVEGCLKAFLAATLHPEAAPSHTLAAWIFARGAADAAARQANLDPAARHRLETALLGTLAGPRRRAIAGWRRTLGELSRTPRGGAIHRGGERALHAWLRGEAPAKHFAAVLRAQSH